MAQLRTPYQNKQRRLDRRIRNAGLQTVYGRNVDNPEAEERMLKQLRAKGVPINPK